MVILPISPEYLGLQAWACPWEGTSSHQFYFLSFLTYLCVLFIYLFISGTRVWAQGLSLARQMLSHLSHSTSQPFFVLGIFEIESQKLFAQAGFAP
jgi:hypothetical protein